MQRVPSFLELAKNYRAVFFDAFGVLKNHQGIITGVFETLKKLQEANIDYFVITNDASKSPEAMAESYTHPEWGVMIPPERSISSGLLACEFLKAKIKPGRVAYLGKKPSEYYITTAGHEAVPISEIDDYSTIDAFVFLDDEGFDWFSDINRVVNLVRQVTMPVMIANPDLTYPTRGSEVAIAVGSLGNMLEHITGKTFLRFGKPDTQIMAHAFTRALEYIPDLGRSEALMVGDTLDTDIISANKFRIDSCLVLSGNTQAEKYERMVDASSIIPTFVADSINT